MFVNYHLNVGVDHMYLFFDDPNDPAIEALQGNAQVTCIPCTPDHWAQLTPSLDGSIGQRQLLNSKLALKLAEAAGYTWLSHIDSDELLYSTRPLKTFLRQIPAAVDVVHMPPLEAVPEALDYDCVFQEMTLFKQRGGMKVVAYTSVAKELKRLRSAFLRQKVSNSDPEAQPVRRYEVGWEDVLRLTLEEYLFQAKQAIACRLGAARAFRKEYFNGHLIGKSILRVGINVKEVERHRPIPHEGDILRAMVARNVRVLHFDACGFEGWKLKWLRRHQGLIIAANMRPVRRLQLQEFSAAYEQGDTEKLIELYKQQYFLTEQEKAILVRLGLATRLHLNAKLFQAS